MHRRIVILLVAGLVAVAGSATASTFMAKSTAELVADSSAVVTGHVMSVDSFWNEDHSIILSEIVVEVDETVVGKASRFVTLRIAGGTVDGYTVVAHGFPVFKEGERALIFLSPDAKVADRFRVTGYQQGHYRVVRNRLGEDIAVPTVDSGAQLLGSTAGAVAAPKAQRLDDFEQQLRSVARNLHRLSLAQ